MNTHNSTNNSLSVPKITYLSPMYRQQNHRLKKNGVHKRKKQNEKLCSTKYLLGYIPVLADSYQNSSSLKTQPTPQEKHFKQKSQTRLSKLDANTKSNGQSTPEITPLGKFHNETKSGVRRLLTFALANVPKLLFPAGELSNKNNEKKFITEYIYTLASLCVGAANDYKDTAIAGFEEAEQFLLQSYTYTETHNGYIVYFVLNPSIPKPILKMCLFRMFSMFGQRDETNSNFEKPGISLKCNEMHYAFFKEELGVDVLNIKDDEKYESARVEMFKRIDEYKKDTIKNFNNELDGSSTSGKNSSIGNSPSLFDIDYNMLKDVPQSELSLVVENIHAFRNDVLIKEQDKLQKEKLTELARQREKLKKVYKNMVHADRSEEGVVELDQKEEEEEEEEEEEDDDDGYEDDDGIDNDEQLEEQRVQETARAAEAQYETLLDKSTNSPTGLLYKYKQLLMSKDDDLEKYKDDSQDTELLKKLNQYCAEHIKNNTNIFNKNDIIEQRRLDDLNRVKFGTPAELDVDNEVTLETATATSTLATEITTPSTSGIKISLSSTAPTSTISHLEKLLSSLLSKHLADSSTEEDNQEVIGIIMDIIKDNSYNYDLYHEELEIILGDLFEGEQSQDSTNEGSTSANVVQDILAALKNELA